MYWVMEKEYIDPLLTSSHAIDFSPSETLKQQTKRVKNIFNLIDTTYLIFTRASCLKKNV